MPVKMPGWSSIPLKTGQVTVRHIGDAADYNRGMPKAYEILTTGQFSATSNLDVAHYAAATISFTAPDIIADSANGLVTFLNADTIVVKGSASNDGTYTIASGGAAADHFHVAPNVVNEGAARYVSMYKRAAHSNNCVLDKRTGIMWSRYNSSGDKVGPTSDGKLNWYDLAATCFMLHPAAADLQIVMPGNILRIVGGAAEITRYHVGDIIVCAGFANAVNLLPGYRVTNVAVNGADLDITLWTCNQTLIAEAAAGVRSIKLICRSIYGYAAAANTIALAGYSDWIVPNAFCMGTLIDYEPPTGLPDAVAFPGFGLVSLRISNTDPTTLTQTHYWYPTNATLVMTNYTSLSYIVILMRGV